MMWHIIEKGGERQTVLDLQGYDGWTLIGTTKNEPPTDHHWDAGAQTWVADAALVAAHTKLREVGDRERLVQVVKVIRNRLERLETRQQQIIDAVQANAQQLAAQDARIAALEGV